MQFFVCEVMSATKQLRGYDAKLRHFGSILENNRKVLCKTTDRK